MSERVVTIVPEAGLHARPATKFVETAREYDADVTVGRLDGEPVGAESMLGVTGLGVASGEDVRLTAEGPDADAALDALEEVLTTPEEGDEGETEAGDADTGAGEEGAADEPNDGDAAEEAGGTN